MENAQKYFISGQTCRKLGKFEEAIKYFEKAKEISSKLGDNLIEAITLDQLCCICYEVAKYKKALEYAKGSLAISKKIRNSAVEASAYNLLGIIHSRLGCFSEAIDYLKKAAVKYLRTGKQEDAALVFNNLGEVNNRMGEHERAIKCCKHALKIANAPGNMLSVPEKCFLNMGNAYCELSRFREAIENCEKSLAICKKREKDMDGIRCEAICYGIMANAYKGFGQREKAITYYKRCVEINDKLQNHTDMAIACGNLGQYYYEAVLHPISTSKSFFPYLKNSIKYLKQAIQIINQQFFDLEVDKNKTSFCDRFYHWHVSLAFPFLLTGRDEAALLVLDLGKAKALRMLIAQRRKTLPTQSTGGYRDESWISIADEREKERLSELSKEIHLKKSDSTVVIYTFDNFHRLIIWTLNQDGTVKKLSWTPGDDIFPTALAKLQEYISPLLARVSVRIPREYSFCSRVSSTSELQTEGEKRERTTLVDKASSIATNDTKKKPTEKTVSDASSTSKNLQRTASDHKVELQDETQPRAPKQSEKNTQQDQIPDRNSCQPNVKDSTEILSYLYQALVGPVKDVIQGTKLIIVPHGCLFFVPFSSLIDENGCYLSEKYQVQITPSVHTLAASLKDVKRNDIGISLFVGNPEVGEVNFKGHPVKPSPLPAATKEVQNLASLLGAKPLVEADATKERVIQLMRDATIVHIAAHGNKKNGDIFLAPNLVNPKNDVLPGEETYLLTQNDVLDSKLAARLVVLSCCHSGRGDTSSEGVLGIARSFLGAGARAVLVALWRIHDEATQEFMEHFYAKLCHGTFVCKALKETINIFQQHEQYNSFSYWAPFSILGEDVQFTKKEIDEIRIRNSQTFN